MESSKGAIKKRRTRNFQISWLDESSFKGWLAPHPSENKALCTVRNKTIKCHKTNLIEHSQTVKHMEKVRLLNYKIDDNNNTLSHKDRVKRAEIKLAAFFAEHNVAFSTVDHLIPLIKDICIDSKIAQNLSLPRKKCSYIVKNIIAKHETEKIVEYLKTCRFFILVDESTDISDNKIMCILVRYVSPLNKKVSTSLLDLLFLDATDCSANKIFDI